MLETIHQGRHQGDHHLEKGWNPLLRKMAGSSRIRSPVRGIGLANRFLSGRSNDLFCRHLVWSKDPFSSATHGKVELKTLHTWYILLESEHRTKTAQYCCFGNIDTQRAEVDLFVFQQSKKTVHILPDSGRNGNGCLS